MVLVLTGGPAKSVERPDVGSQVRVEGRPDQEDRLDHRPSRLELNDDIVDQVRGDLNELHSEARVPKGLNHLLGEEQHVGRHNPVRLQ